MDDDYDVYNDDYVNDDGGKSDDEDNEDNDAFEEEEEEEQQEEEDWVQEEVAERDVFGRVGISIISSGGEKSPKEVFRKTIAAIFDTIKDQLKLSKEDLNNMSEPVERLTHIQYKNPTAYILGYFVTSGGKREITKKYLNDAEKANPDSLNVTLPDIIRYSVYWKDIVSKK